MNEQDLITRIRVTYTKGESLRFTGHLDIQRLWERLLRRSGLPIRYSQGFHPRARLNLASALPLGFISDAEMLDFWMDKPRPVDEIKQALSSAAPPGLIIQSVEGISMSDKSLQSQMHASEYEITFFDPQSGEKLQEKISELLAADEISRTRRNKSYNLRPLILDLAVIQLESDEWELGMRLLAEPGQTGRPDEVLEEMGYQNTDVLVKRTKLMLS